MDIFMQYHAGPTPDSSFHYAERSGYLLKTTRPLVDAGSRFVRVDTPVEVIICGVSIDTWVDGTQQIILSVVPVVEALGHQLFDHTGWFRKEIKRTPSSQPEIKICTTVPALQDAEIDSEKKRRIIRVGRSLPLPGQIWLGLNRKESRYYLAGLHNLSDVWIPKTIKDQFNSR